MKGNQSVGHIERLASYAVANVCKAGTAPLIHTVLLWLLSNRQCCVESCKECAVTLLVAQFVAALRHKPEGRGFDSRWCHWNFTLK